MEQNTPPPQFPNFYEEADKPIDIKYYLFLFKKNFYVIFTFLIIVATLAFVYVSKIPNRYQTKAQLMIERPTVKAASLEDLGAPEAESFNKEYYITQVKMMTNDVVMRQVVEELKLADYFGTDTESATQRVKGMVSVARVGASRLFDVNVIGLDAKLIAKIANSLSAAYIRQSFENQVYYSREILNWLPEDGGSMDDLVTIENPFGGTKQLTRAALINSLPSIQSDPTIRELRKRLNELESDLKLQLQRFREKHPVIIKSRANLKFLQESLEAEKSRIIGGLKSKAEGRHQVATVRIIQKATPPDFPLPSRRNKIILFAIALEILISFGIILIFDYFDDTIHSFEDIERRGLILPFLGPIPVIKAKERDPTRKALAGYYDKASGIAESFRYLRVAINFSATPEALKNLVITSCLPHEGKSFVSHNTAVSLAQDGNKTLLIDADMRRPTLDRVFKLDNSTGLSNYLTSNLEFNSVVKETFIENLMAISSGPMSPNPGEILASERMKKLLNEARTQFDRIIIDCPPLTGIGDGFVIGGLVGYTILVISANKTPADLIKHTQVQLERANIKLIGVVLNMVDMEKERHRGYSKHYYHTYNRYYQVAEGDKSA